MKLDDAVIIKRLQLALFRKLARESASQAERNEYLLLYNNRSYRNRK